MATFIDRVHRRHDRWQALLPILVVAAGLLAVFVLAGCAGPLPATAVPTASGTAESPTAATPTASGGSSPTLSPGASATATPDPSPADTPEPTTRSYTIASGDSLSSIAERFGLTVQQLLAANPQITDPDHIEVGTVLTVPPPDGPIGLPTADAFLDETGDLVDESDQPAFAPGYVDLTELEARVDAQTLFIEVLAVASPPFADPGVEQVEYSVYVDTDDDDQADFQLRMSNDIDPDQSYAAVITDLASGATSIPADFPGTFSAEGTIRFEVSRSALGASRRYGVAATSVRRYFPGGVGDPEVATAIDRIPEQAWPRVNAQWLEVGL